MAAAGVYALLSGRLGITDRLSLKGWQARLVGGLWLLPLASILILWMSPGYEITTFSIWPTVMIGVAIVGTIVLASMRKQAA
jgi:hypothetical protein